MIYNKMHFENLYQGNILKRPSAICKSPYMADVLIDNSECLVHSPSLGCSGLTNKDSFVFLSKIHSKNTKSSHRIEFSKVIETWNNVDYEHIVCTNPQTAEKIIEHCLENNILECIKAQSFQSQVTFENSRFDFAGIDENETEFILEVKSVPVADYHNVCKKTKNQMLKNNTFIDKHPKNKIAIFPDGYIKPSKEPQPQSERANKHILELTSIKQNSNKRSIMMYVVQRSDASSFVISDLDPIYKENVKHAQENGVEVYFIQLEWTFSSEHNSIIGNIINENSVVF